MTTDLSTDLTLASESIEQSNDWPPAPVDRTYAVTGALADRIRARLRLRGEVDEAASVTLRELTIYGGTEWTRENSTDFTVTAGTQSETFYPDSDEVDWVQEASATHSYESVFARFDAWLQVTERTSELADEWFEFTESCKWWDRWTVREDSVLARVLRREHPRADHFQLERIPEPVATDFRSRATLDSVDCSRWRLDAVAARDDNGFAAIIRRYTLFEHSLSTDGAQITVGVLADVTDELFLGHGW